MLFDSARRTLFIVAATCCATAVAQPIVYPKTAKVEHTDSYFGTTVADPYRWLEDDNSSETKAWVQEENKVTDAWFDGVDFRAAVRTRVRALANYPKYSAPTEHSGAIYFYKNDGLQNQSVLYVQKGIDGTAEVLLDPNTFSTDSTVRLTSFTPSKDGRYAAYSQTAIPGSDWNDIRILDLKTRKPLPEVLRWVKFSGASWRGDGFYYSRYAEPAKGSELTVRAINRKVYFHRVGTEQGADVLVFEDPSHPDRFTSIGTTEDERFTIRTSSEPGKRGNDLWVRDESKAETAFRPLVKEIGEDRFNVIDDDDGELLVQTTRGAPN
ncbi:MAG: S9 family peptidase, partial [Pseudomonadota bacterium]|nr:S9 family peptidase [Pseudomonadota bacterium]